MSTTTLRRATAALTALGTAVAVVAVGALPAASWVPPSSTAGPESPAVTAAGTTELGVDADFAVQRRADWGSVGPYEWSHSGSPANWTARRGTARVTLHPGQRSLALLEGYTTDNAVVTATLALNKKPTGTRTDTDVVGRQVGDDAYALRIKHDPSGALEGVLVRRSEGRWVALESFAVADTVTARTRVLARLEVTGTSPTTIRAKVWRADRTEPTAWGASSTDSTPALQAGGQVGVGFAVPAEVTNRSILLSVDDFQVAGAPATDRSQLGPVGSYVPDASTTGAPAGTDLVPQHGNLSITEANTIIDGADIHGFVVVDAPGVIIRNSIIRGGTRTKQNAVIQVGAAGSLLLEDSEVFNSVPSSLVDGVRGSEFTLRRVNIHHVLDPVHIYGDNTVIEASYVHDNYHYESDPAWDGNPSHDDTVQINSGTSHVIRGNSMTGAFNTGIQFTQNLGKVSDVVIEDNFLDGGGCTINFAEKGKGPFQDVVIRNNTFGRTTKHLNCAIIAPLTSSALFTTSGNYFTDGAVASVRKG